jgi:adenosylcobinamide-GDP ribazoletransferase
MVVTSLRALLQFTTILPLGAPADFESFARRSWLYPVAGWITGGLVAIAVFWIPIPAVAAGVAIALLLLLSGANHFDGLLDLGDGLMVHGDPERRIRAMTDRQIGAGGIAIAAAVLILIYAGLQSASFLAWPLLIGEVGAAFSMAFLTAYGNPVKEGIHSFLHSFARPVFPLYAAVLCIPLILLPVSRSGLAVAAVMMVLVPLIVLFVARRLFGGVNGDVVGGCHEITRAVIIVALVLMAAF